MARGTRAQVNGHLSGSPGMRGSCGEEAGELHIRLSPQRLCQRPAPMEATVEGRAPPLPTRSLGDGEGEGLRKGRSVPLVTGWQLGETPEGRGWELVRLASDK